MTNNPHATYFGDFMNKIENLCQSFPDITKCNVSRDNMIELIEGYLENNKVVFLQGEEGVGKTILLAQFVKKHSTNVIAYFLKLSSEFSCDLDIIGCELFSQINFLTDKTIAIEDINNDFSKIKHGMYKLHKKMNIERKNVYIVLDGFCEISNNSDVILKNLIDNLPVGYERFRFIFSGSNTNSLNSLFLKQDIQNVTLAGFSEKEGIEYFDGTEIANEELMEVLSITKNPGFLSIIKKTIENGDGFNFESLARNGCDGILEAGWCQVDDSDEQLIKIIAITCYNKRKTKIQEISKILNMEIEEVKQKIHKLTFLKALENSDIEFNSDLFRKFVQTKLVGIKNEIQGLIIENMMSGPLSSSSIALVPALLKETGDYDRLLSFLSPECFHKIVDSCQSLYPLQGAADLGVEAAYNRKKDNDLMRLGLQRSIMTDLDQGEIIRSEVEATLALGDEVTAITIAHSCSTREERLHALALIVRAKQEQGLGIASEITEEIRQLSMQIDPSTLGEKAFEIAETLSLSHPELAVDLLERTRTEEEGEEDLDLSLAKLSFSTLGFNSQKNNGGDAFNAVHSKIKNPRLKKFISSMALLLDKFSSAQVLEEAEKFEGAKEKLIFLKEWLKANKNNDGAGDVIENALNIIISTTEYSPTAKDYREIAIPLPCLIDKEKRIKLAKKINEQKLIIEKLGPTEEIIHLDLILANSKYIDDAELGIDSYVEIYLRICEIDDLIIKTICLSFFIISIKNIDCEKILEVKENLHSLSETEFEENIIKILNTTAQHYEAFCDIIKPLARHFPERAILIADKLNVVNSRDKAYCDIIKISTNKNYKNIDSNLLRTIILKINDYEIRDSALIHCITNIISNDDFNEKAVEDYYSIFEMVPKIKDIEERCRISCNSINFLKKYDNKSIVRLVEMFVNTIAISYENIDVKWIKVNVGLKLTKHLSEYSMELAKSYYDKNIDIRKDNIIDSYSYALNYISCIYMLIRSFSGLINNKCYNESDIDKILKLIDEVPSYLERSKLFSVLSLNFYIHKDHEKFISIVSKYLIKCIDNVPESNLRDDLVCKISPSLFLYHRSTSYVYIDSIPLPQRDDAIFNIIDFIFKKTPPNDPFESYRGYKYDLKWIEIQDICELIQKIDSDSAIYLTIERLSEATTGKHSIVLSNQQRTELSQKLNEIITKLLPRPNHISHDGYLLISKARILRIKKNVTKDEWENLIDKARSISNLADKIYVIAIIAATMPSKDRLKFDGLIDEAVQLINNMPSAIDKVSRYEIIADMLKEIEPAISRKCLKLAMDVTRVNDRQDLVSARKNLVDLAYRIDPDYALALTAMFDDDPARTKTKDDLKKHYRFLQNKKKMVESLESADKMSIEFVEDLPITCWRSLGSLNAGRYSSLHIENVRKIIQIASKRPMLESFPMLSFGIQNINSRYQNTDKVYNFIRPLFEAVLVSSELAKSMARRASSIIDISKFEKNNIYEDTLLIRHGDRDKAIAYIINIIENSDSDYVKICDNFFGKDDLDWLKYIANVKPKMRVHILTSKKQQNKDGINGDYEDSFSMHWRVNVSDQPPPTSDITVVGTASKGDLPIHDRWIILKDCGIRIGTSLKSIGISKDAELSLLSESARSDFEANIDEFLSRSVRERDGERVSIVQFNL